jgi:undecaprenyl-diphosphatase
MIFITIACAKYLFILVAVIAVIYCLRLPKKQKIELVVFGVIAAVSAYLLAKLGSAVFYDARPFVSDHIASLFPHVANNGFPSDHTLFSAVIAVTVFAVSKKWGLLLGGLTILVGVSRVLAHVHHPIDVIGSVVFAILAGLIAYSLTPRVLKLVAKQ